MQKVILLTGPAGAGKSTAANTICEDDSFSCYSFAGPIRRMLSALGLRYDYMTGEFKNEKLDILNNNSPRHAMQTLGTEWGRSCMGMNFWAQMAVNDVKDLNLEFPDSCNVVFDDVRFPNEIDLMRENFDTTVIKIIPAFEGFQPIDSEHASESQELDWHYSVRNKGDLNSFRASILDVMKEIDN